MSTIQDARHAMARRRPDAYWVERRAWTCLVQYLTTGEAPELAVG